MPNRVIKESIWNSPTLAKLPLEAQLHWPRWLLLPDDWGCFNADPDVIKGLVYPKIQSFNASKINKLIKTYYDAGLLFTWEEADRQWGYFVSFNNHHFCNKTHLDEDGKQVRHKRKTPIPRESELNQYLEKHLEQVREGQNKYRIPNPIPIPKPKHIYGEFKNVKLTDKEVKELKDKLNGTYDDWIKQMDEGIELKGYVYKSHYLAILKWVKAGKEKEATQTTKDNTAWFCRKCGENHPYPSNDPDKQYKSCWELREKLNDPEQPRA